MKQIKIDSGGSFLKMANHSADFLKHMVNTSPQWLQHLEIYITSMVKPNTQMRCYGSVPTALFKTKPWSGPLRLKQHIERDIRSMRDWRRNMLRVGQTTMSVYIRLVVSYLVIDGVMYA